MSVPRMQRISLCDSPAAQYNDEAPAAYPAKANGMKSEHRAPRPDTMKLSSLFVLLLSLLAPRLVVAATIFQKAEMLRQTRPHFHWPEKLTDSPELQARLDRTAARLRVPFGFRPYLSKLLQDSDSPLTTEQKAGFARVRDKYAAEQARLHDEWNSVRMEHIICGWRYAKCSDAEAPALRDELEKWIQLYLRCHADLDDTTDRQSRELWALLTPAQQQDVLGLRWQKFARSHPGHAHDFREARLMLRAVGPLDEAGLARFNREAAMWEAEHRKRSAEMESAVDLKDRLRFYYDTTDRELFQYALPRLLKPQADVARLGPEAMRSLYRQLDPARGAEWNEKIAAALADTRETMLTKYSAKAMLMALGETPR